MAMNSYTRLIIETFLVLTTLGFVLQHIDGFKITFTSCTEKDPMLTVFSISITACLRQCDRMDKCETVLYIRLMQICQLHHTEPVITGESCDLNPLIILIHTRTIYSFDTRADVRYCPMFEAGENAVILGNRQRVGTKLQLTCASSYAVVGERAILCNTPSAWTRSGQCIQICDAPTPTENMIFGRATVELPTETVIYQDYDPRNIRWFENSAIVISCLDDAILLGSLSITCSAGSWSELPACKIPTMRQPCEGDAECVDTNSECRGGRCWCRPELSYNPTNMTCVSSCQVYGNTFQVVEGIGIYGLNFYIQHTSNKEACMSLCLTHTTPSYECKQADYMSGDSKCFLTMDVTPIPNAVPYAAAIDYLLRDCE